jgi:hypothetical protein
MVYRVAVAAGWLWWCLVAFFGVAGAFHVWHTWQRVDQQRFNHGFTAGFEAGYGKRAFEGAAGRWEAEGEPADPAFFTRYNQMGLPKGKHE